MSRAAALPPAAASWLLNLTVSRAAKPPRPVASRSPNPLEHRPPARRVRATGSEDAPPGGGTGAGKSGKYTDEMQRRMGGGLTYKHEEGINFSYVLPDVVVGSCPQSPADVDRLAEEGIGIILCLQEDQDAHYFGFDISDIQERCIERGDITHIRCPTRDFDPFSLRRNLPRAVALLHSASQAAPGKTIYIHCTAGLGRAPATALAYMHWIRGFDLMEAYSKLMEVRPCHPKLEAIRAATCDILFDCSKIPCQIGVYRSEACKRIQVAGLDVGWGQLLDLEYESRRGRFVLKRDLLPGRYPYKFVWDGHWSYSADHPTFFDGEHVNNYIQVQSRGGAEEESTRLRLTSPDGLLTAEERKGILQRLSNFQDVLPQGISS